MNFTIQCHFSYTNTSEENDDFFLLIFFQKKSKTNRRYYFSHTGSTRKKYKENKTKFQTKIRNLKFKNHIRN